MVLENVFPPDIRVEKEATALTEAGHAVHLLAFDFTGQPAEERVGRLVLMFRREDLVAFPGIDVETGSR